MLTSSGNLTCTSQGWTFSRKRSERQYMAAACAINSQFLSWPRIPVGSAGSRMTGLQTQRVGIAASPWGQWAQSYWAWSSPGPAQQLLDMGTNLSVLERVVLLPVDADLPVPAQQFQHCAEALSHVKVIGGACALLPGIDGQQLQGILRGQVRIGVLWIQLLERRQR